MNVYERLAELEEEAAIAISELVLQRRQILPQCECPEFRKAHLRRLFASQSKMISVRRLMEARRSEEESQQAVAFFDRAIEVCATVLAEVCETVSIIRSKFPVPTKV